MKHLSFFDTLYLSKVVVDEEIECWFILGEKINNYYENCYKKAKNLFSTDSQQQLAQRAVKKLDSILQNRDKNRSFDYFKKNWNLVYKGLI
jgi:hypothetical protein